MPIGVYKTIKDYSDLIIPKLSNKNNVYKFFKYNKHNENFEIKQFKRIINYYGRYQFNK